jgi:hypothetical protein
MHCPNYPTCQLIQIPGFIESVTIREAYITTYCNANPEYWSNCKRYQTHHFLGFCPDFIFPDSSLSLDEIIDRFDIEISQTKNTNK